ncbi:cysteine desulfurase sulfur acceptor subunit CsdE [Nissabacter sp. SGAir0207]|nr:cysteine desulfurase sulfur acceptor subunit CsdE [Nissabacter sp. SGAir0207]
MLLAPHPFGTEITLEALVATFTGYSQWEDRYRQLIQLARRLPPMDEALKTPARELSGCENRVWFDYQRNADGTLHFYGDSEGRIVKGLLAVILTAVEGQTPAALRQWDLLALFDTLGLRQQLSATRAGGLQALADAVARIAATEGG